VLQVQAKARMRRHLEKSAIAVVLLMGCGSSLRTVPRGPSTSNIPWIVVDYPPPPAEVEQIPPDPGKPCAWQDGHWDWLGRRWKWIDGQWVIPPSGCHYVDPWMSWVPGTKGQELHYWLPRWLPNVQSTICKLPVACPTRRTAN